jgi:phospholipase A1
MPGHAFPHIAWALTACLFLTGCLTTDKLRADLELAREELAASQEARKEVGTDLEQAEEALARAEAGGADAEEALSDADRHLARAEGEIRGEKFPVAAYKSNFFLFLTHDAREQEGRKSTEAKFQVSLKKKITCGRPRNCWDWVNTWLPLYFGYTQKSFWQVYDKENSSPFRENNYNPELFLDYRDSLLKETPFGLVFGLEHESNGQSDPLSRSWNRAYFRAGVFLPDVRARLKVWHRFAEDAKTAENPAGDDNPEIERFLGNVELELKLTASENRSHQVLLFYRPGSGIDFPTFQVDYLYHPPFFNEGVFLQLHAFDGYGESLIDFDHKVRKIGFGLAVRPADSAFHSGRRD